MKKIFFVLVLQQLASTVSAQVTKVESTGFTVRDMSRSLQFYTEVFGFRKVSDTTYSGKDWENLEAVFGLHIRVARLQLGDEFIELTDYLTAGGRNIPDDAKSNDLFFQHIAIVVSDMTAAFEHIRKFNVEFVSTAPQTLPRSIPAAEGIKAFYFHDPDNHTLELIYFPKGKGMDKWHKESKYIFLGIDHTAIGVSNSDNSHLFYQDLLGIDRKGDSWNKGMEQEHLNNVEGASLHITGYRANDGIGIEFLQYLIPGPGREYPQDSRANDIWHWQTTLIVNDAEALYKKLTTNGTRIVSREIVQEKAGGRLSKSFLLRDPDGHGLIIKEYLR